MRILSGLAGGTVSARNQRKNCRFLAYEALVVRVDDFARELVPRNGRKWYVPFLNIRGMSLPQIPHACTFISTSPGSLTGVGTSSYLRSPTA